jgi:urea transport system substrate-binding protein
MKTPVEEIPVGLLYSRSGPYAHMGAEMINGALLAIEEINSSDFGFRLAPISVDPGGDPERYEAACAEMINRQKVTHIVGCYTSASRKQVLPQLARSNALLWHPARYEGFEACENIVYVGAAPNQHVVPLARHMIGSIGRDVFCVGSNYIWTWETNRVLREIVETAGGSIVGERVVAFGDTDITHLVDAILEKRPAVVFNTLVGQTSYAFFRVWEEARRLHGLSIPILSCSLSEPELKLIGPEASVGHVTSSVYFDTVDREENRSFVERYRRRFGASRSPFSDAEASYVSVMLLGRAIRRAGRPGITAVLDAAYRDRFEAPHGAVWLDPKNNHCYLTPRLATSRADFHFDVFWQAEAPVRPDPYLARLDPVGLAETELQSGNRSHKAPYLRVVR